MTVIDVVGNTRLIKIANEEIDFFDNLAESSKISWDNNLRTSNIFPISQSIVGYIVTPFQTIELKSKYKEISFAHILRLYLYTVGFSKDNDSQILDIKDNADDYDLSKEFLTLLAKEIQVGIHREYRDEAHRSKLVSGNVNFKNTFINLIKNTNNPIVTQKEKLTVDTQVNALISGALSKLIKNPQYSAEASALIDYFYDVKEPVLEKASDHLKKIVLNSQTIRYEEILQLAVLIIDNADYSDLGDNIGVKSFLINFDTLFENFIIEILKDVDDAKYNFFSTWKRKNNMLDKEYFQNEKLFYQPDILYKFVEKSPNHDYKDYSYGVLDCKNKAYNIFSNSDVYQMISYSTALKSERSILIYPSFVERPNKSITFDYERFSPSKIYACFINIAEDSGDDFIQSINNFRNKIFEILN